MEQKPVISEDESFFVTGGTMRPKARSYVARGADDELYKALMRGDYCYVLDTRQMGKSSLVARAADRVREERSASVATVDLQRCGQSLTIDQWYEAQVNQIAEDLDIEDEVEAFWDAHGGSGPLDRWIRTIRQVILPAVSGPLVIFIDEIDFVRSLPFPTDEFFGGIRGFFSRRAFDPELRRLSFCLVGVAVPNDLIRNEQLTPFNIGRRIDLADFSESETVGGFAAGFSRPSEALLKRVWHWTEGHPYLTQKLAEAVAEDPSATAPKDVDQTCEGLFLSAGAREQNDNLRFVASRLMDPQVPAAVAEPYHKTPSAQEPGGVEAEWIAAKLDLYRKVLTGEAIPDERANPYVDALRLSGVVRVVDGKFQVRNRVYRQVFDEGWIKQNIGEREQIRQEEAFTRGRQRATRIAGVVILVGALLGLLSWGVYAAYQNRTLNAQIRRTTAAEKTARMEAEEAKKQRLQAVANEKRATENEQRAKENEQRAVVAEIDARQQAELAAVQKNAAITAQKQAETAEKNAKASEAKAIAAQAQAEQSARDEANQRLVAQAARERAESLSKQLKEQNEISTPLRLAARSEMDRALPDLTVASTLVGLEALNKRWSSETYSPVLQSLALLPHDSKESNWEAPLFGTPTRLESVTLRGGIDGSGRLCVVRFTEAKELCTSASGAGLNKSSVNYLIASFPSGRVSETRYWDIWNRPGFENPPTALPANYILSPSGKLFAAYDAADPVIVREFPSGNDIARVTQKSNGSKPHGMLPVQFSSDDRYLITREQAGSGGYTYLIWEISSRKKVAIYPASTVQSFQFSPNLRWFRTSAGGVGFVPAAPSRDQDQPTTLTPLFSTISGSAEFSADGTYLTITTTDSAYLYRLPNAAPIPFPGLSGAAQAVFNKSGRSVAFVVPNKYARVFETGRLQETARILHPGIRAAVFTDDDHLVTASPTGATTWNIESSRYSDRLPQRGTGSASLIAFSPSGDSVVTARGTKPSTVPDYTLTVLDISSASPKEIVHHLAPRNLGSIHFTASSNSIAVSEGLGNKRVAVFALPSGQLQFAFETDSLLKDVSPDGKLYVFQNGDIRDAQNKTVASAPSNSVLSFPDTSTIGWSYTGQLFRLGLGQATTRVTSPLSTAVNVYASADRRFQLLEGTVGRGRDFALALWDSRQTTVNLLPITLNQRSYLGALSRSAKYVFFLSYGFDHWEIRGLPSGTIAAKMDEWGNDVRFSSDERYAAVEISAGSSSVIRIANLATGAMCSFPAGERSLLGFDQTSSRLVTRTPKTIEFWRASDCVAAQDPVPTPTTASAVLSPDGRFLAWIDGGNPYPSSQDRLEMTDTRNQASFTINFPDTITAAAFNGDGKILLAGAEDGTLKTFDMTRKSVVQNKESRTELPTPAHDFDITSVAITPDGRYSASAAGPTLRFWQTGSAQLTKSVPYRNRVMAVAFDQTGARLGVGMRDGTVEIRRVPSLEVVRTLDFQKGVFTLDFSADGQYLGVSGESGRRVLWDTAKWQEVPFQPLNGLIAGMFAPTGHQYAVYSAALVEVWNGEQTRQIKPDAIGTIGAIAFSADGHYLLIGGSNGVRIWDLAANSEVGRIGDTLSVRGLANSPDGKLLSVTYSNGSGILSIWRKDDLIAAACQRLGEGQNKLSMKDDVPRYFLDGETYEDVCHPKELPKVVARH